MNMVNLDLEDALYQAMQTFSSAQDERAKETEEELDAIQVDPDLDAEEAYVTASDAVDGFLESLGFGGVARKYDGIRERFYDRHSTLFEALQLALRDGGRGLALERMAQEKKDDE